MRVGEGLRAALRVSIKRRGSQEGKDRPPDGTTMPSWAPGERECMTWYASTRATTARSRDATAFYDEQHGRDARIAAQMPLRYRRGSASWLPQAMSRRRGGELVLDPSAGR